MTPLAFPLCLLAILAPLGAGRLIGRMYDARTARVAAAVTAASVLALTVALCILQRTMGANGRLVDPWLLALWGDARPALGVDSLSGPLLVLVSIISLITITAWPRHLVTPRALGMILITQGLLIGLLTSLDFGLLTAFWILSTVPALIELRRMQTTSTTSLLSRTWTILLVVTALPMLGATAALSWAGWAQGAAAPLHLTDLIAHGLQGRAGLIAGTLVGLAVILRGALLPAHGWVTQSFEHGPSGTLLLFWATQPGAYLLARVLIPLFSSSSSAGPFRPEVLAALGLCTAIYAALLGLAQTDMKRVVGCLATSYGSIVIVGLLSRNTDGISGGLVLWLSLGLALTGLALTTVALEARTGTTDMRRLGGLSRTLPRLTACFLVFGLAAVGLPGMLGFVAEDMLLHGLLESYPSIAATLLVATVLNGINVMRVYTHVFVGEPPPLAIKVPRGREMRRRERVAAVALVGLLLVLGLIPQAIVSLRSDAAVEIAGHATTNIEGTHHAP
jgi:NADH-quinone oxidoreductase subunit M